MRRYKVLNESYRVCYEEEVLGSERVLYIKTRNGVKDTHFLLQFII